MMQEVANLTKVSQTEKGKTIKVYNLEITQPNNTCTFDHFSFHAFCKANRYCCQLNIINWRSDQRNGWKRVSISPKRFIAAVRVPPVATKSSITTVRSPGSTAPTCISKQSVPYSSSYACDITSPAYLFTCN